MGQIVNGFAPPPTQRVQGARVSVYFLTLHLIYCIKMEIKLIVELLWIFRLLSFLLLCSTVTVLCFTSCFESLPRVWGRGVVHVFPMSIGKQSILLCVKKAQRRRKLQEK